jgi:hypothetical protein
MAAEGQRIMDRQAKQEAREAKRKAREDFLNEKVQCAFCQKSVVRKSTVEIKGLGHACKSHPGVA